MKIPSTYDLEALRRDVAQIDKEIRIFTEKTAELKQRRLELLKIISAVEEYQSKKNGG